MMTTAGNGPGPSGLLTVAGISSRAPLGAVVMMERSETGLAQPASSPASSPITSPFRQRGVAMVLRF